MKKPDRSADWPTKLYEHEYLVVTDKTSQVLKSTTKYNEAVKLANLIRRGGGEVTIFKATKG